MQASGAALPIVFVLIAGVTACSTDGDTVAPGYYGALQAGSCAPPPVIGTSNGSGGAQAAPRPAGSSGTSSDAGTSGGAGQPAPQMNEAGTAGTGMGTTNAMDPRPAGPSARCDLSGRWIATMHLVNDALGEPQYGHYFEYYEIEQQGDAFTITNGLMCGWDSVGVGDFASTADFSAAWPGTLSKLNYAGRTGTSVDTGSGCKVELQRWYTVRGATVPYYNDPSTPLPSVDDMATATTPGWEDWDSDGNPGITGNISGIVTGKIFVATRMWTSISDTAADVSSAFKLLVQWNAEPNVMSYDGTPLLGSESARASDDTLHFVQLARLAPGQATGDDAAICKSIVELAPTLTPEAAGM
jgi:hypothetical protein